MHCCYLCDGDNGCGVDVVTVVAAAWAVVFAVVATAVIISDAVAVVFDVVAAAVDDVVS